VSDKPTKTFDTSHHDVAKAELKALEREAILPPSGSASFIQVVGVLAILGSVLGMTESVAGGLIGIILSGFIIASGHLQQTLFDIRTLMLRDAARRGVNGLIEGGRADA
jgi:hypothetical protein